MNRQGKFWLMWICVSVLMSSLPAVAQDDNDERFQDLFMTAGYTTALGAALGAAALTFKTRPENHLRYISIGASLGFIGGTALGSYMIFAPMAQVDGERATGLALTPLPTGKIVIRPHISTTHPGFSAIEAGWKIAQF